MLNLNIILGITGSIAAYKTPDLVRRLREQGAEVRVVLTQSAKAFVTPLSLQAVSGKMVHEALLDPETESAMSHIELARWATLILIAPASANFIAKLTHGFADDLLSTLCLATQAQIIIAPAMNQAMWSNAITQENIKKLSARGFKILETGEGSQACGETGFGRMLEPLEIVEKLQNLSTQSQLNGKSILITAGPTQEALDPVRYISNRSSGKMGYALAEAALNKGAIVTLISGPTSLNPPPHCRFISVKTADEMLRAVQAEIKKNTIFISTAAVADYRPTQIEAEKIKKTQHATHLELEPTVDILAFVTQMPDKPFCVGFAAETEHALKYGEEKRLRKKVDLMIVNDVSNPEIGFESNDNAVTVLSTADPIHFPKTSKKIIAQQLIELIEKKVFPFLGLNSNL